MSENKVEQPTRTVKIGDLVHYVMSSGRAQGQHRPAIVVNKWTPEMVQLQVFTDATNDVITGPGSNGLLWATSVHEDQDEKKPHTWHWPEEV